jgi:hypothetical protein
MNRICARWVPRMLSEENMTNRTEASRQFLRKFSQSGIGFLDRILTTDETWFHYYDPEIKQQYSQWKNVDSPRSKIDLLEFQCLCYLNTNERLTLECVTDCLINLCVSVGVFPMSTQNFITSLCSTLIENVVFSDEKGFIFKV